MTTTESEPEEAAKDTGAGAGSGDGGEREASQSRQGPGEPRFPVTPLFRAQVEDAEALVDFALRSSHSLDRRIVSKVIAVRAVLDAARPAGKTTVLSGGRAPLFIDAELAAGFHGAFSELSVLLKTSTSDPEGRFVTPESIRLSRRFRFRDALLIALPFIFAVGAFLSIVVLQTWWFSGTTSLRELDATRQQAETTRRSILEGSFSTMQQLTNLQLLQEHQEELRSARTAYEKSLGALVVLLPEIVTMVPAAGSQQDWSAEGRPTRVVEPSNQALLTTQAAKTAVELLSVFVLPALYGLLGASLYVLRRAFNQLAAQTLTPSQMVVLNTRLLLGGAAGPLASLLVGKDVTDSLFSQVSPFALALVVGYSVDIFFASLDRLVDAVKSWLRRSPTGSDSRSPGAAAANTP